MSRSPATEGGAAERILVVDDDDAARYAKIRILRQAGYSILESGSGESALRVVKEEAPDLVMLDVRLPDISGLEVCRIIKSDPRTAHTSILQMSATMRDDETKIAGLECGADGYLTEPVEPTLLLATVAAYLRTRRAEIAVRRHAVEWQTTFNAIGDGVALVDTSGVILRSNAALAPLLNQPIGDLAGARLDELLPPSAEEISPWRELEIGRRRHAERALGEKTYSVAIDPVGDPEGKLLGAVCIVSDITDRKLMNERLWHTQKLESIGLLAGGVAHDFNNLLTGILGNASLGLDAADNPDAAARAFSDIIRASERAADLTRQLLAYAGKGKFIVKPIDLSQTVAGMLPLVKTSVPRKVEIDLNLASDLPAVEADKTQVEQIVMNLMINAAEAIGEKRGKVTVTTKAVHIPTDQRRHYFSEREVCGDYVMLEVKDNGQGMSEDTIRQIFDPFFTTKFMGRGLGLSAVLGIMRGHKGAIRVTSAPGRGASFELLFPSAAAPARMEHRPAAHASAAKGRGTVLVVDDEQIVRDFFQSALERHGYEVVTADNGAQALQILSDEPLRFSLIILDIVMPVMSGKEALPHILQLRPDARVIITSGQVEEEVRRDLSGFTIAGFIQKPCGVQQLLQKVQESVGSKSLAMT